MISTKVCEPPLLLEGYCAMLGIDGDNANNTIGSTTESNHWREAKLIHAAKLMTSLRNVKLQKYAWQDKHSDV